MLRAIARAVDDEGWRIIALMRLGAPLPSAVQNYLFGLTNINIVTYAVATLIFSSPQVILCAFLERTAALRCCRTNRQACPSHFRW